MLKYFEKNVNPKNRKTGDCSTRAIVGLLDISYDEALDLQIEEVKKCYYDMTSRKVMERILNKFGYVKCAQPRKSDGTKYQVREMDKVLSRECLHRGIIVNVANHYVVIRDNYYQDIWDSGKMCVGNYFMKIN